MKFNYDFPWYIQQSPVFMTLYRGFYDIAVNASPLPVLEMLNIADEDSIWKIVAAGEYYGVDNKIDTNKDALIYDMREWSPREEGQTEYYWDGSASEDTIQIMSNYTIAKTRMRGKGLSLLTLKEFYETALAGFNYSVEGNITVVESLQHFEIVVRGPAEITQALVEMTYTDRWPFGKPVGISYNITYVTV